GNNDYPGCGTGGSTVKFLATAGQTYLFRVAGNNGARGNFTFHLEDFPAPANGTCATATPATSWNGSGPSSAGDNPGSVNHAFDATTTTCGGGNDTAGVWYSYTPTGGSPRLVEVRTCQDSDPTMDSRVRGVTGVSTVSASNATPVLPLDTTLAVYT